MKYLYSLLFVALLALLPSLASAKGITLQCDNSLAVQMDSYLKEMNISNWVDKKQDSNQVSYTLKEDMNTRQLKEHYGLVNDTVYLPLNLSKMVKLNVVSKKEILLALMHKDRETLLEGNLCNMQVLHDYIGVRQNIVAWSTELSWFWPDGGSAKWNKKYWLKGTPVKKENFPESLNDIFFSQGKYGVGCYTATKIVISQGVLDYYHRIKKDKIQTKKVIDALWKDSDPLVDVEPPEMWSFEDGYDIKNKDIPGKLLRLEKNISQKNMVPGDWVYFLNTDKKTYQKTGYEGSNAIYLGQDKFDDYYNDHNHSYTYKEKVNEVYQWRHEVFSRSRDFKKIVPISDDEYENLGKTPEDGGILLNVRLSPYLVY
jgi:Protein-glutamine gamma-glutamyltransferase